jgi:hypothetical protein
MADGGIVHGAKAGWGALKAHWLFFLVAFLLVGIGFLAYDYKKKGDATKMFSGWPIIGKLFACAVLAIGFHAHRLLG